MPTLKNIESGDRKILEIEDRTSADYWNARARQKNINDSQRIWYSPMLKEHEEWTKSILEPYKDNTILDVGCGLGRLADIFLPDKYEGFDFSDEMIKIAQERKPEYKFFVADCNTFVPKKKYDVILACMLTNKEDKDFIDMMRPFATKAIIRIYSDRAMIVSPIDFS